MLRFANGRHEAAGRRHPPGSLRVIHDPGLTLFPAPEIDLVVKRIYADARPSDGTRILVDRLWPRGVSKQRAALDGWMRELAPSTSLRRWFGHDPARWAEFCERYRAELRFHLPAVESLRRLATVRRVTLLYAARDPVHNHAMALREFVVRS